MLDIIAYFTNHGIIKNFLFFKPKVKILNSQELEMFALKYNINSESDRKKLKRLNYYILREHFMQVFWLMKYRQYISNGIPPQEARILLLKKYTNSSMMYKLKYGQKSPMWLENVSFAKIMKEVED